MPGVGYWSSTLECGVASELVVAGFSRFEEAPNTRRAAVKVGVVERVD